MAEAKTAAQRSCTAAGRSFAAVDRLADIQPVLATAGGHSSILVIMPGRSLTFAAANSLIEAADHVGLPIGVLPLGASQQRGAPNRAPLDTSLPARAYQHRTALYCEFLANPPAAATAAAPVFGQTTSGRFIRWLDEGVEAAVLHTHGNGADFRVGSHVLCVQVGSSRPSQGRPGERFLPCQAGGRCRLEHKTSFTAYHGADAVRSRLLVLLSCSAVQPADGLINPRFSFVNALMQGKHTQGIIASTRINFGTPELSLAALASIDAGRPLGEIARRINGVMQYGPPSYLCLGDPELRLSGAPEIDPAITMPRQHSRASPPAGIPHAAPLTGYLFLADVLRLSGPVGAERLIQDRLRRAALAAADSASADHELDHVLAQVIVERIAASHGPLGPLWQPLCEAEQTTSGPACLGCGKLTHVQQFRSRLYRDYRRSVRRCDVHGILSDTPAGSYLDNAGDHGVCLLVPGTRAGVIRVRRGQFAWLAELARKHD